MTRDGHGSVTPIPAGDAALRAARAEIESLEQRLRFVRECISDICLPLGVARNSDKLSAKDVITEISRMRAHSAVKDKVIAAARLLVNSPIFPRTTKELLRDHYALVEALARLDAAPSKVGSAMTIETEERTAEEYEQDLLDIGSGE